MNIILAIILIVVMFGVGVIIGFLAMRNVGEKSFSKAQKESQRIVEESRREAEALKKEKLVEAKDEIFRERAKMEKERDERRNEQQRLERRLLQKDENLDKKLEALEKREKGLTSKEQELARKKEQLVQLESKQRQELEKVAKMSTDEAKDLLLKKVEDEIQFEIASRIKTMEEHIREMADLKARRIISTAIQKWAADQVVESTVSVVSLPSDEMKGRIIGREGRNIRMLESLTGVDLIIDDTPEAVILSSFDPIRREIARMALEKLILDARIHPARIEEMVEKARKEMDQRVWQEGEQATFEAGVTGLHPELIRMLGKLRFRTSYGQNVLSHSLEVAFLAGAVAAELGTDVQLAKRAGLLHDIGKAVNTEVEGPHALIGGKFAEKYNESQDVVHAINAHHEDEEQRSVEASLIQACDAISAARPGARRETLEAYIKRLEKLEKLANAFEGVDKSYAIQAGREIRIMVKPEMVDDVKSTKLARDIVKQIEQELDYPGQIKVTVIRETRVVDFAK
ncbi:MAG: ribonuclease Y [Candidatus Eremiobacteraeota bacterium]|nr:ribonuclease Y [Candidatus Eremiobacteraeota bacterium]